MTPAHMQGRTISIDQAEKRMPQLPRIMGSRPARLDALPRGESRARFGSLPRWPPTGALGAAGAETPAKAGARLTQPSSHFETAVKRTWGFLDKARSEARSSYEVRTRLQAPCRAC
jgi:hypothetical protein